jgi:phenylacetate-CoA ligase
MTFQPNHPFPVWPPFFASRTASLREALAGLEQSERWPEARIMAGQQAQLTLLLQWAAERVPYYRDSGWAASTLEQIAREPESFQDAWRSVPILTKATLRAQGPQLNAPELPAAHMPRATVRTSGSTGIPVEVGSTSLTRFVWDAMILRENLWRGRDCSKRLGFIRYYARELRDRRGKVLPAWPPPISRFHACGPSGLMHVGYPVDVLAAWLRRFDPHYLITHPSVAGPLMDELGRHGKPPALEEVSFVSEPVSPVLEERLRNEWGVRCSENYSANEPGFIAFRCGEGDHLHVQSEAVLVEILDDAGRPCQAGESGRVVITPLHNLATPLIRYEIGDLATAGAACACGRSLPVIRQVLGRVRNLVRTPDGRRHWPVDLAMFNSIIAISQCQLIQSAIDTIQVRLVLKHPLTEQEQAQVVEFTRAALRFPFTVEIVPVAEINRGPTGKFEEFLSLLPDA